VSQIFRAGSKTKNRALLHKGFRKPKSGARINKDTNEIRYIAVGYLDNRLHILYFTKTLAGIRVISFRKANPREAKKYGKSKTLD
jgi:uncharacterized DUF497 family protein